MTTETDLDFIIECLGDVLTSHNDRCISGCNCYEMYDRAVAIVTEWDRIIKAGKA